ncbi:MAG: hypothetical protein JWM64_1319, partial [Frankiales bacterium]|nr:hypothetical protein [Frankiales bacterium]
MRKRTALPVALAAAAALTAGVVGLPGGTAPSTAAAAGCPAGTVFEREPGPARGDALQQAADTALTGSTQAAGECRSARTPEPSAEVMAMNAALAARRTGGGYAYADGALEAATAQQRSLAVTGSTSRWNPLGKGPLDANVDGYDEVNSLGLNDLAGRVEDLAYDPAVNGHFFAAVANGGIWSTSDAGASWRSIGEKLPTQITGAVAYLINGTSRTLLAGTGDPAFGGTSFSGQGVFRTVDGGAHWIKATGVPAGTLTFSFAYDQKHPSVVYAATSKGLYRSADAGTSFRNVVLPTTCTDTTKPTCFFANIVTDVAVKQSDAAGKGGGAVLAAVGWRAGLKPNALGKPQSPRNGLYSSATGLPGSFAFRSNAPGFAADDVVGRTSLGAALGPKQDHGYVYALVQDQKRFNGGALAFDLPDVSGGQVPNNTVLDGLYGSKDFGATWTKLADATQLALPTGGSALQGAQGATYAPGIQSWYNSWVTPDPTSADADGVPTRLAFGLEEVWSGSGAIPAAPGTGQYSVVGRYFSENSCGGLNTPVNVCPLSNNPVGTLGDTTHPDQHAGLWAPTKGSAGVTLLAGNDGGVYKQTLAAGEALSNDKWGKGINNGFTTLLPYDLAMAKDGTAVMGLQDNGSALITPAGKQIEAYGGDGFFVAVDPADSKTWYEEYTGNVMSVTKDGGKSWTSITPPDTTGALFAAPFAMDPTNAKHLIAGGRNLYEDLVGPDVTVPTSDTPLDEVLDDTSTYWKPVFDLGTRTKPGVAGATAADGDPANSPSALDTRGNASYAGYCGYCDIVTGGVPFSSGIATNVGGSKPGKAGSPDGWHIAKAKGLPERYVNSVRIDPKDPKTVYVTLGGYGRRWIPPGSLGDDVSKVGTGHVFVSHDAGESFTDLSRNLPDVGANDAFPFAGGLVVANDLGVAYLKNGTTTWTVLGTGLPAAPVFRLNLSPRNPRELLAASYGRGAQHLVLP